LRVLLQNAFCGLPKSSTFDIQSKLNSFSMTRIGIDSAFVVGPDEYAQHASCYACPLE
jgi:hypothetical protein